MMVRRGIRALVILMVTGLAACDEAPLPPAAVIEQQAPATQPAQPTTQELLEGPRKVIQLGALPLTAKVPQSWEVKFLGEAKIMLLQGPAPHGDVQIQLGRRPSIPADRMQLMFAAAQQESTTQPTSGKTVVPRALGKMKIIERQSVIQVAAPSASPTPMQNDLDRLHQWSVSIFVPSGADFDFFELNFVLLTPEQYQADEKFLRDILDTLEYKALPEMGNL